MNFEKKSIGTKVAEFLGIKFEDKIDKGSMKRIMLGKKLA